MRPVVVTVLRSGGDFVPAHVIRLWKQLRREGGWRGHFVCLTDTPFEAPAGLEQRKLFYPWAGWWSKLELCAPEQATLGDILYLDLDSTVVGSIKNLAEVGRTTLLRDFFRPARRTSGVMYLTEPSRRRVWEQWIVSPEERIRRHGKRGDGSFYDWALGNEAECWQSLLPDQIVSFKEHVRIAGYIVPDAARIVCFHGHPRPWEVVGWHWGTPSDQKV